VRFFRSSRRQPREQVVFAGERIEAEFVVNLLREEGFHPLLWADLPAPVYAGPLGMARVVVPRDEGEGAKDFLASLEERGLVETEEAEEIPGLEGENEPGFAEERQADSEAAEDKSVEGEGTELPP